MTISRRSSTRATPQRDGSILHSHNDQEASLIDRAKIVLHHSSRARPLAGAAPKYAGTMLPLAANLATQNDNAPSRPLKAKVSLSRRRRLFISFLCATVIFLILVIGEQNRRGHRTHHSIRLDGTAGNDATPSRCRTLSDLSPSQLGRIESLNLKSCNLTSIPSSIGHASKLRHLDVSDNPRLTTLPRALEKCSSLSVLFSSSNPGIRSMPSVLGRMVSLTRLGWRSGSLEFLEAESMPPNLVHLILTANRIRDLDDARVFERMRHVRKLMLSHNRIKSLSAEGVGAMRNLELIRLGGNNLESIPEGLWSLPKLAWVTLSGNPRLEVEPSSRTEKAVPVIRPSDLVPLKEGVDENKAYLGQGASGTVTARTWNGKDVAVKIIHGVTSDGRAEDELKAYESLGMGGMDHRVVGCVALLDGTGARSQNGGDARWKGRKGVVMDRLPPGMVDLALPPTIEEVTSDRWWNISIEQNSLDDGGSNTVKVDNKWNGVARPPFSPTFVLFALRDLANALLYLHKTVGLVHGDIYGHNVKVDAKTGRLFLLDLGASWATGGSQHYALHAERVEVRAFGVLVGELAERITDEKNAEQVRAGLRMLGEECRNKDVRRRPTLQGLPDRIGELLSR